jgi:hypothetical protein
MPSVQLKSEPLHVEAGLPLAPLHSAAKDRRAPLVARRRDRPPRIAPLQSAPFSGTRMILRERLSAKAIAYLRASPFVVPY